MVKRITVIGEVDSQNIGDQAIYYSLSNILKRKGFDVVGVNLSYSSGQSKRKSISIESSEKKGKRIHKYLYSNFTLYTKVVNLIVFTISMRKKYNRLKSTLKGSYKVVIGGGQLLQNNNLSFPLDLWLVSIVLNSLEIKYSIVGCGVGVKRWDFISKWLVSRLLKGKNIENIYVRDQESINILQKVFDLKAQFIPDPAVSVSEFVDKIQAKERIIGLGIMSANTLKRNKNMLEYSSEDFIEYWIEAYLRLNKEYPENRIELFTTGDYSDYLFANLIQKLLEERYSTVVNLVKPPTTVKEFISSIQKYEFVLSMRLHSHIIAYSLGIPSYGIIWEDKVKGFSKYAGIQDRFSDKLELNSTLDVIKRTKSTLLPNVSLLVEDIEDKINIVLK